MRRDCIFAFKFTPTYGAAFDSGEGGLDGGDIEKLAVNESLD